MKFLTMKDLVDVTGLTSAGIYLQARQGRFPRPVKPTSRMSRWRADEVEKVLAAWSVNASTDEIKAIVASLPSQQSMPPLQTDSNQRKEQANADFSSQDVDFPTSN